MTAQERRSDSEIAGDVSDRPPYPRLVPGILLLVAVAGAIDLVTDRPRTWVSPHVVIEVVLLLVSLTFSVVLWRAWGRASVALGHARRTIAERQAERDAWRESARAALAGLGAAVDSQFDKWGLTGAEREVALQLLKGQGHKQIAARTGRSERTVRQHAVSVYEKSGLGGRAELAAFFLEGVMLPVEAETAGPRSAPGTPKPR